jgi:diguanylate cyclase (GGDEF)-like protein
LLLLDLDKFKEVNDGLGHHVGDQLLAQVGVPTREQLREGDLLARLGGDEFSIVLADVGGDQAAAVATKLRCVLADPFSVEGIVLRTQASIGIALTPDHGNDLTGLLRRADIAMYKAKRARLGHHVFTADDDTATRSQLRCRKRCAGH